MPVTMERKVFAMEIKEAKEQNGVGIFTGIANVMDVIDMQDEVIDEGAFDESIKANNGSVMLLADHDPSGHSRLGIAEVKAIGPILEERGRINLEKQIGREMFSDIKFHLAHNKPLGNSVGFMTESDRLHEDRRHIVKADLWEVSVVTFPANLGSRITGTKAMNELIAHCKQLGIPVDDMIARKGKQDFALELLSIMQYADILKEGGESVPSGTAVVIGGAIQSLQALLVKGESVYSTLPDEIETPEADEGTKDLASLIRETSSKLKELTNAT